MEHSSPDEYDYPATDGESDGDRPDIKAESSGTSPSASNAHGDNAPAVKALLHLQKRRRVTRACDECRRKKIKCDGRAPCTHCTVYSYECTYDQPSNRRRNPAPQYVENLEHRVHRAETLLHILIPNLDLSDPGIDAAVAQGWIPGAPGKGGPAAAQQPKPARPPPTPNADVKSDTNLESMVRAVAQLDMDEQGHWDYHGHSSGLSFVRRMREQLGDIMGPDSPTTPFIKSRPLSQSQVIDSPKSIVESPMGDLLSPASAELPPKDMAARVCGYAVSDAAALLRTVHQPTFWDGFERIYNTPQDHYTNEESKFLPLFYSAMALGSLFGKDESSGSNQEGYEGAIQHGFSYFRTARHMMDIADCRDLTGLQAIIFMILFLQSSAKLSQCYAYIGVVQRSALRMGLHRAAGAGISFDPVEAETRKRVFWIIRKLDIYVAAMLGLPQSLSDDDIDQEFPAEVDDEYITRDGILPMPEGTVSLMTAFNAHTRLVQILSKIVRRVYPTKVAGAGDKSYSVPFSTIREIESDLEQWKNALPAILNPCEAPPRYTRLQQLLRLSYAHAQVMLYRPFLHFTAMDKRSKPIDQRAYACAASFVNVSRNIIHITTQMKQKGLLNGAYWFVPYTAFFSILALVYFAAENPDNATTEAVMKNAIEGKEVLESLASRSMAADRCSTTLRVVFQRLPAWMRDGKQNPVTTKKRAFQASEQPHTQASQPSSRSHPNVAAIVQEPQMGAKRASTFPRHGTPATSGNNVPLDSPWPQSLSSLGIQTPTTSTFDMSGFPAMNYPNGSLDGGAINGMQQFGIPANFAQPELNDLSTMIFPTADEPFVYPNQPLTTFENNQQFGKGGTLADGNSFNAGPPPSHGCDENMEAQFYPLPPYLEQQQQQQQQVRRQQGMNLQTHAMPFTQNQPTSAPHAMPMPSGNWSGQQAFQPDLSNINIQDLFGGNEWNPMMMHPGYQQPQ